VSVVKIKNNETIKHPVTLSDRPSVLLADGLPVLQKHYLAAALEPGLFKIDKVYGYPDGGSVGSAETHLRLPVDLSLYDRTGVLAESHLNRLHFLVCPSFFFVIPLVAGAS
jgi:hypothetical protein